MPLLTELTADGFARGYKDFAPTELSSQLDARSISWSLFAAIPVLVLTFAPLRLCVRFFFVFPLRSLRSFAAIKASHQSLITFHLSCPSLSPVAFHR